MRCRGYFLKHALKRRLQKLDRTRLIKKDKKEKEQTQKN